MHADRLPRRHDGAETVRAIPGRASTNERGAERACPIRACAPSPARRPTSSSAAKAASTPWSTGWRRRASSRCSAPRAAASPRWSRPACSMRSSSGSWPQAGSRWTIADFRPGDRAAPEPGARGCSRAGPIPPSSRTSEDVELLRAFLARGPRSVVEWCARDICREGSNLLLLVDQFEELFRYSDYARARGGRGLRRAAA